MANNKEGAANEGGIAGGCEEERVGKAAANIIYKNGSAFCGRGWVARRAQRETKTHSGKQLQL